MLDDWVFLYILLIFCGLSFLVNPVFVYLIFTEKSSNFGNYRFLLLYFALFNLIYSIVYVAVPLDIHSYRYCFFLTVRHGWFSEASEINFGIIALRCTMVAESYAVLLIHFIYRYLVIQNSSLTRHNFHWYLTISALVFALYFVPWYAVCYFPGRANVEIKEYIRKDFFEIYGTDSMDYNMLGALFHDGSNETIFRSWVATMMWTAISTASIIAFTVMTRMIVRKLRKISTNASKKTSKFQFELLRALIVQTVIPILISFSPCLLCWYSPMFGIPLAREINYLEICAFGVFPFVDPVAIIMCLPVFRKRIFCSCKSVPALVVGATNMTDLRNS